LRKKKENAPEILKNLFYDLNNTFLGKDIHTNSSKSEQGVGIAIIIDKRIEL